MPLLPACPPLLLPLLRLVQVVLLQVLLLLLVRLPLPPLQLPSPLSPEAAELATRITAQGEVVRSLKTAKAPEAEVKAAVDALMALKVQYKELTGKDHGAAPKKDDKKEKAKAAPAAKPVVVNNPPPQAPPSAAAALNGGAVDLVKLNQRLSAFAFVGGFEATQDDAAVAKALAGGDDVTAIGAWAAGAGAALIADKPHVKRWVDFVAAQDAEDIATW